MGAAHKISQRSALCLTLFCAIVAEEVLMWVAPQRSLQNCMNRAAKHTHLVHWTKPTSSTPIISASQSLDLQMPTAQDGVIW